MIANLLLTEKGFTPLGSFSIALLTFLLATVFPMLVSKGESREKFIDCRWLATVFPACCAFYVILKDGIDELSMEYFKSIILWAMVMAIIFTLGRTFENAHRFSITKGDIKLEAEMQKKVNKTEPEKEVAKPKAKKVKPKVELV
jgi:predicted membrane protein